MQLVIDIGNTKVKAAVFQSGKIQLKKTLADVSFKAIEPILKKYAIKNVIFSSVASTKLNRSSFKKHLVNLLELTPETKIPVRNLYTTPATLGKDRLANAVAVAALNPGKNNLVIDAGTCLKFDFVNAKNEYLGGAISPGLHIRYKSLHHYTDKLPEIDPSKKMPALTGNSTRTAIQSGVQQGMLAEITGIIRQYKKKYKGLHVYLTGGDAPYFERQVKKAIFAPDLTLYGLNEILLFNTGK